MVYLIAFWSDSGIRSDLFRIRICGLKMTVGYIFLCCQVDAAPGATDHIFEGKISSAERYSGVMHLVTWW